VRLNKIPAGFGESNLECRAATSLGTALLRRAFIEFFRRGTRRVALAVDTQSLTGATRLYERAGMWVERLYSVYRKELRGYE
jgi:ribosomal protein S18 acetylase RimI-like enzyme